MKIKNYAAVELSDKDIREAIVNHIAAQNAGDGPTVKAADVEFFLADGKGYSGTLAAMAVQW